MSQKNVDLVRAAFGGPLGSLEEMAQTYWHRDVEYLEDPRWPGASRYLGREAVLDRFRAYRDALGPNEAAVKVEQVFDAGERQVPFVRFQGRSASGVPHEHLWAYVVEVRDGRIAWFRAYYEAEEALEAAGLRQ